MGRHGTRNASWRPDLEYENGYRMSVKETFTWTPPASGNETTTYRVRSTPSGDGDRPVAADGIDNKIEFWPVSFTGTKEEIRPIKDFLDRHAGYQAFYWTPPVGEKGIFRSFDIILTPLGGEIYTLSTVFEQVF